MALALAVRSEAAGDGVGCVASGEALADGYTVTTGGWVAAGGSAVPVVITMATTPTAATSPAMSHPAHFF